MHERTLSTTRVFEGRILTVERLEIETGRGTRAQREVVRTRGAVAVLCRRPDGHLVFVRQYRKPAESEILEIAAGCMEAGESPDACARREVREETGYMVETLRPLGAVFTSPGYSAEAIHLFDACVSAHAGAQRPDQDEDLDVVVLTPEAFEREIAAGAVVDAKTLSAWTLARLRPA